MNLQERDLSTGQSQKNKSWRRNLVPFVALVAVIIVAALVVQYFKKPGQMNVIESQAMDMSAMKPPPGAVPVAIATVKKHSIEGSITYTGTVQAYEDEDVYARITGRIVSMTVYPGDRVKKGQLVVELDPPDKSEYAAKLAESRFAADSAIDNASIARQDFSEKSYTQDAAKASESAAADELQQAKADRDYWVSEIKREETLLKNQVISQQEYDDELNKFKQASAKFRQMEAKLQVAKNSRLAAGAAVAGASRHVGHIALAARQAEAARQTAAVIESYTRIRARDDGVVVKRLVSPGVVVSPGTLILKISHLKQVRVQAQVASEDAEKVAVGNPVYISSSDQSDKPITAKITSIFPSADASTRTVIVEALVDNVGPRLTSKNHINLHNLSSMRMLPGDYVVMRIVTDRKEALAVPSNAVTWREGKPQVWKAVSGHASSTTSGTTYTCIMHPEIHESKPGKCPKCGMDLVPEQSTGTLTAQLVSVTTGLSDDRDTEIASGISAGDQVVYQGYASLQNGMPVIAAAWGASGPIKLPDASSVQSNRLDANNKWTADVKVDDQSFHLDMQPKPPSGGNNRLLCTIVDGQGKPISHAALTAKTSMPTMSMPGPNLNSTERQPGTYELTGNFTSGLWQVDLHIGDKSSTINIEIP